MLEIEEELIASLYISLRLGQKLCLCERPYFPWPRYFVLSPISLLVYFCSLILLLLPFPQLYVFAFTLSAVFSSLFTIIGFFKIHLITKGKKNRVILLGSLYILALFIPVILLVAFYFGILASLKAKEECSNILA